MRLQSLHFPHTIITRSRACSEMAAKGSAADMGTSMKKFFLDNEFEVKCLAAGLVAVALWQVVINVFLGSKSRKYNLPPGPPNLPVLGAMLSVDASDIYGWYRKMSQKFGKVFYFCLGSHRIIVVCSVEGAKEVLRTKDAIFANRPNEAFLKSTAKHHGVNCEDVVFSSFTDKHKSLKKLLINQFLTASQIKRYEQVRRPEGARFVEDIQKQIQVDGIVNVSDALFKMNVNMLCKLIFGRRYTDALTSETDPVKHMNEIIHLHTNLILAVNYGDMFPWLAWPASVLKLGNEADLQKFSLLYRKVFGELIEEHREAKRSNKNYNDRDFLDVLLNYHDKGEISYDALLASLMDLLVGGTDTNAVTTEWVMLELAKNPNCLAKLQNELDEVVGKLRPVEESDLPNMPYLHAVVNEIFRCHSPASLLLPHFTDEATTVQGFDVPAHTTVFVNVGLIGVDPDYWKDPQKFDPERFMNLEEKMNLTEGNLFSLFPFGSGRRKCIGAVMGLLTVQKTVATLVHAFDWGPLPGQTTDDIDRTEFVNGLNRPKTPLSLSAKVRVNPDVYALLHV